MNIKQLGIYLLINYTFLEGEKRMNFSFNFEGGKASISGGFGVLTVVFIILKLTGVISWKWWVVFLPVIIGAGIMLMMLMALTIFSAKMKKKDEEIKSDDDLERTKTTK